MNKFFLSSKSKNILIQKFIFSIFSFGKYFTMILLFLQKIVFSSCYSIDRESPSVKEEFNNSFVPFKVNKSFKKYQLDFSSRIFRMPIVSDQEMNFFDLDTTELILTVVMTSHNDLKFKVLTPFSFVFKGLKESREERYRSVEIHSPGEIKLVDSLFSTKKLQITS